MLRSIDGLAVRQLRTRPLRAVLTGFGVVLGVGMVFGVLLLVGTIRHTFDDLIGSAWGKTDLIVMGDGERELPAVRARPARAVPGVRAVAPMVGGEFTRLDARGHAVKGAAGDMLVAGYDTRRHAAVRLPLGRRADRRAPGRRSTLERNWARQRGIDVGDRIRVATETGPAELPIIGIFRLSSGLSFGGRGFAAMPIEAARRLTGMTTGYMQISVVVDDKRDVEAVQRRVAAALGPGLRSRRRRASRRGLAATRRAEHRPLLLLRGSRCSSAAS